MIKFLKWLVVWDNNEENILSGSSRPKVISKIDPEVVREEVRRGKLLEKKDKDSMKVVITESQFDTSGDGRSQQHRVERSDEYRCRD